MYFSALLEDLPHLTPTETRVLRALFGTQPGAWRGNHDLITAAWEPSYCERGVLDSSEHMLRVNVSRLRRKLQDTRWAIDNTPGYHRLIERAADGNAQRGVA